MPSLRVHFGQNHPDYPWAQLFVHAFPPSSAHVTTLLGVSSHEGELLSQPTHLLPLSVKLFFL